MCLYSNIRVYLALAHWTSPEKVETFEAKNGTKIVRLYNPANNQEEFYSWEQFETAWQNTNTKGNEGVHFSYISASKK